MDVTSGSHRRLHGIGPARQVVDPAQGGHGVDLALEHLAYQALPHHTVVRAGLAKELVDKRHGPLVREQHGTNVLGVPRLARIDRPPLPVEAREAGVG